MLLITIGGAMVPVKVKARSPIQIKEWYDAYEYIYIFGNHLMCQIIQSSNKLQNHLQSSIQLMYCKLSNNDNNNNNNNNNIIIIIIAIII